MKKEKHLGKLSAGGFTIIELIVVIAIIAVLAAIVLVSVTQYINKSKDAAVKANLSSLVTNSAIYFEQNPSGNGIDFEQDLSIGCGGGTDGVSPIGKAVNAAGGILQCLGQASGQIWAVCSKLHETVVEDGYEIDLVFCVDYTGVKKVQTGLECILGSGEGYSFTGDTTCR